MSLNEENSQGLFNPTILKGVGEHAYALNNFNKSPDNNFYFY